MKAVYIEKPGQVAFREIEKPVPQKGEALLKLLYGGICGSDLGSYRGTFVYFDYPRIPGHEFSAEIIEINDQESQLRPGMVVTCNPYFNCGACYSCERGLVNACEHNQTMGAQRDGAFREYITMPTERLIDGLGLSARTLALVEPFCISYHGISRGQVNESDRVLIVGAGTIGIMAAIAAKARGAYVVMADVAPHKLELARRFGIDQTILNESEESFLRQAADLTDGRGFDVCVEAVGLPATFQNCIDACAYGARFILIGVGKQNLDFNFTRIQTKELNIFGSRNARTEDFREAISLIKSGRIDLDPVITDEYSWLDAAQAFEDFNAHSDRMLKVMLKF